MSRDPHDSDEHPMQCAAPQTRFSLLTLYPLAQAAATAAAAEAVAGKQVSCRAGCGACCRQLVAVSAVEAVALADLVAAMPAERQAVVRARFAAAIHTLEGAGLLDPNAPKGLRSLTAPLMPSMEQAVRELAKAYFGLQIACPLLDDESCSVHADRPTICREYHVTSPAENCRRVYEVGVEGIKPELRAGEALAAAANVVAGLPSWKVPLVLALEWAEELGPEVRRERNEAELLRAFEDALGAQRDALANGDRRPSDAKSAQATLDVELGIGGRRVNLSVTVPSGPTPAVSVLPVAHALADVVAQIATADAAAAGTPVSCREGCAACCRHLVPLSEPEALALAALVAGLPEPRRSEVRARFADARRRVEEAGLWAGLTGGKLTPDDERFALNRRYHALQLACPFLEDERCSIYADRPLVCREFMVSSDPEFCRDASRGEVAIVSLPVVSPYRAFARASVAGTGGDRPARVPLVSALDWAARSGHTPVRTGPEWLRALFFEMTGAAGPPPEA